MKYSLSMGLMLGKVGSIKVDAIVSVKTAIGLLAGLD